MNVPIMNGINVNNNMNFEEHMKERIRSAVMACTPSDKTVHVHCTLVVKVDNDTVQTLCLNEGITERDRLKVTQTLQNNLLYSNLYNFLGSLLASGNDNNVAAIASAMGMHLPTATLSSVLPQSSNNTQPAGFSNFLNGVANQQQQQQSQSQMISQPQSSSLNGLSPFSIPFNTSGLLNSDFLNCVMATTNCMQNSGNSDKSSATFSPTATSISTVTTNPLFSNLTSALLGLSNNNNAQANLLNHFPLNFSLSCSNNNAPSSNSLCLSGNSLPVSAATTTTQPLTNGTQINNEDPFKQSSRGNHEDKFDVKSSGVYNKESSTNDALAGKPQIVDICRDPIADVGVSSAKRRKPNKPIRLPNETDTYEEDDQKRMASHTFFSAMQTKFEDEESPPDVCNSGGGSVMCSTIGTDMSAFIDTLGNGTWPTSQSITPPTNSSVDEVLRRLTSSTNYLNANKFDKTVTAINSDTTKPHLLIGAPRKRKPMVMKHSSTTDDGKLSLEFQFNNNVPPLAIPSKKMNSSKTFRCNQCKQMFPSLNSLCEHTFEAHGSFRCTVCDSKFTQRSNLQRHALKHVGFKPFECIVCKRAYYRKDHSIRHVEVTHPNCDPKGSIHCHLTSSQCLEYLEDMEKSGLLVNTKKNKGGHILNDAGSSPSSNLEKNGGEDDYEDLDDDEDYDDIEGMEEDLKVCATFSDIHEQIDYNPEGDSTTALSLVMPQKKVASPSLIENIGSDVPMAHSSLQESEFPSHDESMNLPSLVVDEELSNTLLNNS